MIKFFRHIRRDLMNTGKTGKYFKYAIGEIVLVVIGILIALSLNNWNQDRIESKEEEKILLILQSDYIENQEKLNQSLSSYQLMASECKIFVDFFKPNPEIVPEEHLRDFIKWALWLPKYVPIDGAINSVISSGNISIITNDELKIKLNTWQSAINEYDIQADLINDIGRNMAPIISKIYPIQNLQFYSDSLTSSHFDYDQTRLLSNLNLANQVEFKRINTEAIMEHVFNLQILQEEILAIIREELKK